MQLDTRLPLAAVGERINPAGIMQKAAEFRQQEQKNALQQRLEELKASRDAETLDRRQRAGRRVYSQMQQVEQGTPAQYEPVPMNQGPVINQPFYGQMRETSPAVPSRKMSPEEINAATVRELFAEGDYDGAFDALKLSRSGQASQAKPFGAQTKRGPDGMEYALNMMTGRYEPTGFAAERDPAKPRIQIVRTARGIEVVDLNNMPPGTVLPPEKKPEAKRAPRTQVVTDETGTFVINLDNPSAPAVPVTKPGGAPITKPEPVKKPDITPYQKIQLEGSLRDDFRADSKTYDEIRRQHGLITTALKDKSAAGTLAAATSFMKMLDPGSVVRESELGMALAAAGITDRIMNYANIIQSGKVLTEQQRNEFASLTNEFLKAAQAEHDRRKNTYRQNAAEYGLSPERVVGRDYVQQPQRQQVNILPPASQLPGKIATDNTTGIRYKSDGTKWVRIP